MRGRGRSAASHGTTSSSPLTGSVAFLTKCPCGECHLAPPTAVAEKIGGVMAAVPPTPAVSAWFTPWNQSDPYGSTGGGGGRCMSGNDGGKASGGGIAAAAAFKSAAAAVATACLGRPRWWEVLGTDMLSSLLLRNRPSNCRLTSRPSHLAPVRSRGRLRSEANPT